MSLPVLNSEKPLVLAPMGFVSGGALAAAVSAAGGLGLLGAGYGDAAWEKRDYDTAVIFAGEAVDRIDSVLPARAIVERICR